MWALLMINVAASVHCVQQGHEAGVIAINKRDNLNTSPLLTLSVLSSALAAVILLLNLGRVLTGRLREADLVMVQAPEETAQFEHADGPFKPRTALLA